MLGLLALEAKAKSSNRVRTSSDQTIRKTTGGVNAPASQPPLKRNRCLDYGQRQEGPKAQQVESPRNAGLAQKAFKYLLHQGERSPQICSFPALGDLGIQHSTASDSQQTDQVSICWAHLVVLILGAKRDLTSSSSPPSSSFK